MDSDKITDRLPWEPPATTAITDTESRADQPDVAMGNANGPAASNPG